MDKMTLLQTVMGHAIPGLFAAIAIGCLLILSHRLHGDDDG